MRSRILAVIFALALLPATAFAQNREHLQMNADIRQLQEHVSRLQLAVNRVTAQLEATNQRLEAGASTTLKGFADQQLLINQLASTVQTIRERLDDNTVRVSQLSQEFVAIREGIRLLTDQINTLVGLLQPAAVNSTGATSNAPAPGSPAETPGAGPLAPVVLPASAGRIYEVARGDYLAGRYDSAIEGYRDVIKSFPDAPNAADAQFHIGEAFYYKKECKNAIPEYQRVISNYPNSDKRPDSMFMTGNCYADLKQTANARRMYEQVLKEYPDSTAALQAKQRLEGLGVR